jgi:hypothetical protein
LLPRHFQDVIVAAILKTANRKPISIPAIRVEDKTQLSEFIAARWGVIGLRWKTGVAKWILLPI